MTVQPYRESGYRWYVLGLSALTNTFVVAAPTMCMPVLFDMIAEELGLSLVQIGLIWGITALPGIVSVLLGGAVGDRFGPKRVLIAACLLIGITGALRGLSTGFASLAASMFLFGAFTPFITMNNFKNCGMWFSRRQLGLASGVLSMGMALGFLLSSMLSAAVLAPWLGGWRQVLYLYAAVALVLIVPWLLVRTAPIELHGAAAHPQHASMRRSVAHVARIRNIWVLGLAILGFSGSVQGTLGYLPLFLRGQGWAPASADAALAAFHSISMFFVVPIALWSDRLGTRKKVLLAANLMMTTGVLLLSVVSGPLVWPAVLLGGIIRDGFMAVFMTSIVETEGVGVAYAGTATGFVMIFSGIGNLIAPPVGNSLAALSPAAPFLFWGAMTLLGLAGLLASQERRPQPSAA